MSAVHDHDSAICLCSSQCQQSISGILSSKFTMIENLTTTTGSCSKKLRCCKCGANPHLSSMEDVSLLRSVPTASSRRDWVYSNSSAKSDEVQRGLRATKRKWLVRMEIASLYLGVYGRRIKPEDTVTSVCYIGGSPDPAITEYCYISWEGIRAYS